MEGNHSQINKLYKLISYNVDANNVYSIKVNGAAVGIEAVTLTATETANTATTRNTSIDYYITNNGGAKWYRVLSGVPFIFPEVGTDDIRWRAQLNSLSPTISPALSKIELSYVVAPNISNSTYDALTGELTVIGDDFASQTGLNNDIDASAFTLTGEGSGSYGLTNTADVDITSPTSFTLTLSATDKKAVNVLINKSGTISDDGTVYNLAVAEDWNVGALSGFMIADGTVSISASNVTPVTPVKPVTPPPPSSVTTTTVTVTKGSKGGSMGIILIALMGLVLYRLRRQQYMR
ncbi:hypothetical protein GARC_3538 [Paraglaciecola arctica BSs20135]|uniref:Uncharacterized protein n=1 Tax=Paraglaciecola arctica BSs20135 TaxID=493475 RepID=K6YQP0_9ALTE|nr:hypothetical protein GARC_3538 [Paraglaciecola arctica BSs20135]